MDGTLTNKELTKKFLLRNANEKKDSLKFSEAAIHDFRGLSGGKLNYFRTKDMQSNKMIYRFDRIESEIRMDDDDKSDEYFDNGQLVNHRVARKKRSYDTNGSHLRGIFPCMIVPKNQYEVYK